MLFGTMPQAVKRTMPQKPSLATRFEDYLKEKIVDEMLKAKTANHFEIPTDADMDEVARNAIDNYDFSDHIRNALDDFDFGDMFSDLIEDAKSEIKSDIADNIREEVEDILSMATIQI